jgi:hypothetical protein
LSGISSGAYGCGSPASGFAAAIANSARYLTKTAEKAAHA